MLAQASNNKAMEKGKEDSGVRVGVETVDYHRKRCNPLKLKKKKPHYLQKIWDRWLKTRKTGITCDIELQTGPRSR